jgi:NAD(P)-dependent dehydrogenase (short-subunit alcohol dehydrogenase family)
MARLSKNAPLQSLQSQPLQGKIALVAGATRGAGRGIAIALGEAGATVYCTGRSSRRNSKRNQQKRSLKPGQRETIEETADLVTAAGGQGIAVRVDHEVPAEVRKLTALIKRRHQGLDILVNDVWGGDALTEWSKPFWTVNLDNGLRMLRQAIHSHIITAHYAAPLMLGRLKKLKKKIVPAESSSKSLTVTLSTTAATSSMTW